MGIEQRLLQRVTQDFRRLEKTCNSAFLLRLQDPIRRPLFTALCERPVDADTRRRPMPCLTSKAGFQVATSPAELSGVDRRVGCSRIVSPVMDEGHDGQLVGMETNGDVDTGELPTTEPQARSSSRRDDDYVCGLATPEGDRFVGLEHDPAPRSGYRGSDLVPWRLSDTGREA
jgi:hypothetical protein